MIYKLDDVLRDVRVALDRNGVSDTLIAEEDIDTLSLNDVIRSKVLEAARRIESEAPAHLLEGGHTFGDAVYWTDKGCGWVLLPDDFMRLIVFEMSDWERPVYNALSADDVQFALTHSRYKGLRGTPQRPVCSIVYHPEGRALEFCSCKDETAQVTQGNYLPYPAMDDNGGIDLCERCYTAIVYQAAALVAMTYEETDKGSALNELAKSALI